MVCGVTCTKVLIQIIYIICVSGVVYDVIHDVPFVGSDGKGNVQVFSRGVQHVLSIEPRAIRCGGVNHFFVDLLNRNMFHPRPGVKQEDVHLVRYNFVDSSFVYCFLVCDGSGGSV